MILMIFDEDDKVQTCFIILLLLVCSKDYAKRLPISHKNNKHTVVWNSFF